MPWLVTYQRNGETCHEIDHRPTRRSREPRLRSNETRVEISDAEARMSIDDLVEAHANPAGGLGGA